MAKTGWTVLKIGIHSAFGPNSPMEFGTLDFKNLGRPTVQVLVQHSFLQPSLNASKLPIYQVMLLIQRCGRLVELKGMIRSSQTQSMSGNDSLQVS